MTTVKAQKFDIPPDYGLDWRNYFIGDSNSKGHELINPADWNDVLLPEVRRLEARINEETESRLLRVRGLARLSAWFAFGFTFSDVARYTIEVDQNGKLWRTDASPSSDFRVIIDTDASTDAATHSGKTVAVGVSVTGQLNEDVHRYLSGTNERVAGLLLLRPERELGRECLRSEHDVVALADGVKTLTRNFVKKWGAEKLLLFYFGPLSGACFIGHRLNAVCREIQIMEDQQPGYAPSFLLT